MFLTKMKTVVVLVVAGLAIGGSSLSYWILAAADAGSAPQEVKAKQAKNEPVGDKLDAKPGKSERRIQKVYALAGLFGPKPLTEGDAQALMRVIQGTIEPMSWSSNGGEGTIDYLPLTSSLVINHSPAVQEKIQGLLETLTESKAPREKKKVVQATPRDEGLGHVRILHEPPKYRGIFKRMLAVTAEHFEIITYANQYDGRIEAHTADVNHSGIIRQVAVRILACDDGGFAVTVRVNKIRTAGDSEEVVGRDTDLEQKILRMDGEKGQKNY